MSCCGGNKNGACCKNGSSSSSSATTAVALSLPKKDGSNKQSVWSIDQNATQQTRQQQLEALLPDEQPLGSKCGVSTRGTCCKDLKDEDERHLISPEIVRDVIIGLSDGLTVPFALTAGLSSLGSSKLVVTGGLAELCAGAISMGLGGYLASQAELDHFHYLRKQTAARVLRSCSGEMEREVHSILGPLGINEALSRLVADDLRHVEEDVWGDRAAEAEGTEGVIRLGPDSPKENNKKGWLSWGGKKGSEEEDGGQAPSEDMGLTAFLLKFGEGMEEVPKSRLYISALTIGLSYFIGGLIPLIPYMVTSSAQLGLIVSCIVTGIVLFIFGAFKTYFTGAEGGWKGYLYGATSTMVVGGLAAGAAFGLVKVLGVKE